MSLAYTFEPLAVLMNSCLRLLTSLIKRDYIRELYGILYWRLDDTG